jgi:MFS family permease
MIGQSSHLLGLVVALVVKDYRSKNRVAFVSKVFLLDWIPLVAMWKWIGAFLIHEMSFGLLSVFLPLYITGQLGGSLTEFGIMLALANLVAVPSSFFWGYICDKTRRYRIYILLSFSVMTALLFLFSLTRVIIVLIAIYASIAVFHVAHEAPKNVLISEYYSRPEWERSFASYEALTELGWLSGLLIGFMFSGYGFSNTFLILVCSSLNLIAFVSALMLVKDPLLIFERRLVSIERVFDFAHRGFSIASKGLDGIETKEKLTTDNVLIFFAGLLLFSLASSMLFTPLPVFFSKSLSLSQSIVFGIFVFNTFGSFLGYVFARKRARKLNAKAVAKRANIARGMLSLLLISAVAWVSVFTLTLAVIALMIMGVVYGLFLISTLSLSMELIPEGRAGLFNALIGLGGALGCLLGTYMAQNYGFQTLFLVAGIGFFLSYIAFKTYTM